LLIIVNQGQCGTYSQHLDPEQGNPLEEEVGQVLSWRLEFRQQRPSQSLENRPPYWKEVEVEMVRVGAKGDAFG